MICIVCTLHYITLQYLVSDYLSEITMSLLAAVRNKRPELGFCPDFLESTAPHLAEIKRRGIRLVTNGGDSLEKSLEHLRELEKGIEEVIEEVIERDLGKRAREELEKTLE